MKNYLFSLLAVGLATASAAFTTKTYQQWTFVGYFEAEITDYSKYVLNAIPSGCTALGQLPCVIVVPDYIDTPVELEAYFFDKNPEYILSLSESKRLLEEDIPPQSKQ